MFPVQIFNRVGCRWLHATPIIVNVQFNSPHLLRLAEIHLQPIGLLRRAISCSSSDSWASAGRRLYRRSPSPACRHNDPKRRRSPSGKSFRVALNARLPGGGGRVRRGARRPQASISVRPLCCAARHVRSRRLHSFVTAISGNRMTFGRRPAGDLGVRSCLGSGCHWSSCQYSIS